MVERFTRPYLDADAWIHALDGTTAGVEIIRPILAAVDQGTLSLIMSAIMPLELLGGPTTTRTQAEEERALAALSRPNVMEVPVGRRVVLAARDLRLLHNLDSLDALHLASAVRGRADAYLTYDDKALAIGRIAQLSINEPYWYGDVPLFDQDD